MRLQVLAASITVALVLCFGQASPLCAETESSPRDVATLEDIYGPSGENFQAALGFRVVEGNTTAGAALTDYGLGVDDMVVQWREYRLVPDATSCATNGSCASAAMDSTVLYESNGVLGLTVIDSSPYGMTAPGNVNDCNDNGLYTEPGDDTDCDDNGVADVTAKVTSFAEPAGEPVILNRVGSTDAYKGTLPVSTLRDVPGVLFLTTLGGASPAATLRYEDRWDGTPSGQNCRNDPDPSKQGFVLATATIFVTASNVTVRLFRVLDLNGDQDSYPDTNETVDMFITVQNRTGQQLTNLTAQLATDDPKIDCILNPEIAIGTVPANTSVESATAFRFKVASTADRQAAGKTVDDDYSASFAVTMSADQFDVLTAAQTLTVDLDLNVGGPAINTTTFVEGFEGGFGNFQFMNLDAGKASNSLSDGLRCQYNDPDNPGSLS